MASTRAARPEKNDPLYTGSPGPALPQGAPQGRRLEQPKLVTAMYRESGDQHDRRSRAVGKPGTSLDEEKKSPVKGPGKNLRRRILVVFDGIFIRHTDTRLTHGFSYFRDARLINEGTQQLVLVHESFTMDVHLATKAHGSNIFIQLIKRLDSSSPQKPW
jgi:hypothetical protein